MTDKQKYADPEKYEEILKDKDTKIPVSRKEYEDYMSNIGYDDDRDR